MRTVYQMIQGSHRKTDAVWFHLYEIVIKVIESGSGMVVK